MSVDLASPSHDELDVMAAFLADARQGDNEHVAPAGAIPPRPNITFIWTYVTAEMAASILENNMLANRKMTMTNVRDLGREMVAGQFIPTHQGIAFDSVGNLVDGQHRLTAIKETGISCWLLVARNLSPEAVKVIDLNKKRSAADSIRIADGELKPDAFDIAICRAMKAGARNGEDSEDVVLTGNAQLHAFLREQRDAIEFSRRNARKSRGAGYAIVRAAIGRAYHHVDREKLERFVVVLGTGLAEGSFEHAAIHLRNHIDGAREPENKGVLKDKGKLYLIAVNSIQEFMRGRPGRSIKPAEFDPWPLPTEEA